MKTKAVIQFQEVNFSYRAMPVLEQINLEVMAGEFIGLVGPNGGGKSTLLKIALGLLTPSSGQVRVLNQKPSQGRRAIGYVPQFATFARDFPISVEQMILLARLGKARFWGRYRPADLALVERVMTDMHLLEMRHWRINALSGGQLQRVLIARALACEPEILVLDEPTANIDLRREEDIFVLLKQLNQGMTILVVSHDIGFISQYVHRVACLNRTLICHATSSLTGEQIKNLYGSEVRMIEHIHE